MKNLFQAYPAVAAVLLVLMAWASANAQTHPADRPGRLGSTSPSALIREVKQSQGWLSHTRSFHVIFDIESPAGTAAPSSQPATRPADFRRLEMAFDETRLYSAWNRGPSASVIYWDGKIAGRSDRENQFELTDSPEVVERSFMTGQLWGRNGQTYWWTASRQTQDDFIGNTGYQLTGTEDFHGIACYTLQGGRDGDTTCYVGVADHRLYALTSHSHTEWYADYKQVAPDCWFPMTMGDEFISQPNGGAAQITVGDTRYVKEISVNKPLAEDLFRTALADGTHVHEAIAGATRDYVFKADRSEQELDEIQADAARRNLFAPPQLIPGKSIVLGGPVDPLPLNPLAVNPAAEFPVSAQWLNGKPVKLADLRGKVVLIVFWATWQDFSERGVGGNGLEGVRSTIIAPTSDLPAAIKPDVVVVGVHVPTVEPQRVEKAVKQYDFRFPICIDMPGSPAGWGAMAEQYRVDQLPVTYVIDGNGKVAALGSWTEAVRRAGELLGHPTTQP